MLNLLSLTELPLERRCFM